MTCNPNDPNAHFPIHSQPPNFQPASTAPTEEHARMTARAGEVVRLLEVLRNDTPIFPSSHLPSFPPHPHPHPLDAVTMVSVKGVGSSLEIAIMDVDMPDRAPKRPYEAGA